MQSALAIQFVAQTDVKCERYKYSTDKAKRVVINSADPPELKLNGKPLGTSQKEVHIGIHRNSNNNNIETVDDRVKVARRAAYNLMGAGLCGLNGVGPEIASLEYDTYSMPSQHCYADWSLLDTLHVGKKELEKLETDHRKNLR